jgi:hypothetical protein
MSTARVRRGRATQAIAAKFLSERGWPQAEPVEPFFPGRDLKHMGRLAFEIKATAACPLPSALAQAAQHATNTVNSPIYSTVYSRDLPVALWRPAGYGQERVAEWVLALRFGDGAAVLRAAGYGWPE